MDRVYVMQLVRSFQVGELSRRDFLKKAALAVGSLTAANALLTACNTFPNPDPEPVVDEASTTATDPSETFEGLITADVTYPDPDGDTLMGYLARPDGVESAPAVIVIQEWWGLNDHIKDVARRVAAEGYVALAPDLYDGVVATEPDEARKLVMELDAEEAVREIQHAIDYLQTQEFVSNPQVGIMGFCMGGRLTLQTALVEEDLAAAVAFYGTPLSPEEAATVQVPVLGLFGSEDGGIPVADVRAMDAAFDEAGITNNIRIYEGAGHAFFNDTRASSYNRAAATDAWGRTLTWFEQHLGSYQ